LHTRPYISKPFNSLLPYSHLPSSIFGILLLSSTKLKPNLPSSPSFGQSYIRVNAFLETSIPDVYAAGDVAEFPLPLVDGARVCIGHWQMALKMGQVHRRMAGGGQGLP
jgi:hypothetical protein